MTNHPFIKGNCPHHEGIWGWEDAADQVVMMVPFIRRSMVECELYTFIVFEDCECMPTCCLLILMCVNCFVELPIEIVDHDILWDLGCE